jgi:hypothetical protein
MTAPAIVLELVERFDNNKEAYTSPRYNEAQVRREFIDPFFRQLGWDVDNTSGYAEAYKDVLHEDSLKIGETSKAPDYGFRIGGTRKFFLEANPPYIFARELMLNHEKEYYHQKFKYSWDKQNTFMLFMEKIVKLSRPSRPA